MSWVQVRCPTMTHGGECRRLLLEISSTMHGPMRCKCQRCHQVSIIMSSDPTPALVSNGRYGHPVR